VGPAPAGGVAPTWSLWFRDLPAIAGAFDRIATTRSSLAEDVNDPEAGSRGLNHLNGWEWRLEGDAPSRWTLYGLDFFPLTLEKVRVRDQVVEHVEMVGRLQLPVENGGEIDELANAVRLGFDVEGGRLALSSVQADSTAGGEWPLALSSGEAGDAPRIAWTNVSLSATRDRLDVSGAKLVFRLFDAEWRIPLTGLGFEATPRTIVQRYAATGASPAEPLPPREVTMQLDVAARAHAVSLRLAVRLGPGIALMPTTARNVPITWIKDGPLDPISPPGWPLAFAAGLAFQLLGPGAGAATWEEGALFGALPLTIPSTNVPEDVPLLVGDDSVQFRWSRYGATPSLQLMPGMAVTGGAAPGFVALSFRVVAPPGDVPLLPLTSTFLECVINAKWGQFLQDAVASSAATPARVFGSSAGDLTFGYTAELAGTSWDDRFLVNGFFEVKDLVSWPRAMSYDASAAPVRLTLPAARSASTLDHLRHTIRILFDQHTVPTGIFVASSSPDYVLELAPGKGWNFIAVVEHQLVDVLPGSDFTAPVLQNDRRWVAVQEVRLLSPASLKADLLAFKTGALKIQSPSSGTALATSLIGDATYGYLGSGLRALLAEGTTPALDLLQSGTVLVEASAVHWLKEIPIAASSATALQYLPGGTQLAALSRLEDYGPTDPQDPTWQLLEMPFLGRLQPEVRDAVAAPPATTPPLLQVDPVLEIQRRRSGAPALPPLLLAFTAWTESTPTTASFATFDDAVGRTWSRLEPRALEESWFWIQTPPFTPAPTGIQSVTAALPDTPARLGRPSTVGILFDAHRTFYPPAIDPNGDVPWPDLTDAQLVWRPWHLLVLQQVSNLSPANNPPYGWLVTAVQLESGLLARTSTDLYKTRHHAAASMPAVYVADAAVPSAVVVSPYLLLDFKPSPADADTELRIVIAELLCLEATSGRLRPVATQTWEETDRDAVRVAAAAWAREIKHRLSPESPVAVLRFRELRRNVGSDVVSKAALVTGYDFGLVPGAEPPSTLSRRVFRMRSSVGELRFRDGRFGGAEVPAALHAFEVAPPQVTGVQPLHLASRPSAQTVGPAWPWGLSALRTTVQYTSSKDGVAGRVHDPDGQGVALWWQSLQHAVQYRSALSGQPAAGLPPKYRAPAIRSLLPVLPDPPLPALDAVVHLNGGDASPAIARRQPVLPGAIRTTLVGSRPGALLSMRHQVIRQGRLAVDGPASAAGVQTGKGVVSGSVPVQHRAPRPVPLPVNDATRPEIALQTWASAFDPQVPLLARTSPADEAYFAALDEEPAHRLQMKLIDPNRGEIDPDWDGELAFDVALDGASASIGEWDLALQIEHGGRLARYAAQGPATGGPGTYRFGVLPGDADTLREILHDMKPGEMLEVDASVTRKEKAEGFHQALSFPLRLADPRSVRLPLEPFFVLFEDPEYDRLLASASKHATGLVKSLDDDPNDPTKQTPALTKPAVHSVTLSTDRTGYNPGGQIAVRYDWDDETRYHSADLFIDVLTSTGIARPVKLRTQDGTLLRPIPMTAGRLVQSSLLDACEADGTPIRLGGGETLSLALSLPQSARVIEATTVVLTVDVVAEPVTPAPEAAYALLRRQTIGTQAQVECVRFAWGPPASRIELVNPGDLRKEVVRRRAVFQWTDTARAQAATGYAVQKIARTGATHFPTPDVIERVPDPA
jgi:hypothetical protein